mmetsp:Transcript_33328/g.89221  ORF Transcript_33328/g.89221 Transcript_33328/m.89221 type:complete len:87 (+) Transcript_33328:921-1181(+)
MGAHRGSRQVFGNSWSAVTVVSMPRVQLLSEKHRKLIAEAFRDVLLSVSSVWRSRSARSRRPLATRVPPSRFGAFSKKCFLMGWTF